jgi:hypothetical protein
MLPLSVYTMEVLSAQYNMMLYIVLTGVTISECMNAEDFNICVVI